MSERPFRFGACVISAAGRDEWVSTVRRAEALGFDVVTAADHLRLPAPIASLMLAADATERVLVGTSVLNTAFYTPSVLAREIATVDRFSGGRVEVGLGAGYVRAESEALGLPFPGPGARVDHLERTVDEFRRAPEYARFADSAGPRLLIAGRGDRVLRLAAERADVVAFTGTTRVPDGELLKLAGFDELAERVAFVRGLLGDRAGDVELNLPIQQVLPHGGAAATDAWGNEIGLERAGAGGIPSVLVGSPSECADRLRDLRARLGLSYFTVQDNAMEAFAPVIAELRRPERPTGDPGGLPLG